HAPGESCDHGHKHDCGHDHAPGESCDHGHKHDCGHEHAPGESCGHGHKHDHHDHSSCGHGHHHHHHDGCCGHDHGPVSQEHTTRPAEDGGWACQFRLSDLIPGETDEHGRSEKLFDLLQSKVGISRAHVRRDQQVPEVCVHYEPKQIGLEEVVAVAKVYSSQVSSRYLQKSYFVRGMDSSQCAYVVEHILHRTKGVLQANVSYASERVVIEYDSQTINLKQVEAKIRASGYELEEPQKGHACSCHAHGSGLAPLLEMPLVGVSGVLLTLGTVLSFSHAGSPILPSVLFGLSIFSGGFFAVRGAWNTAMQGRLDIEALMVLAAVGAGALGKFFEGGFLLFLFSLGHALEHRAMERARKSIESLGKLRPETALRKRGDKLETVPIGELRRGDRVLVRPGDRVPVDGVIKDGTSTLDQAAVTGESVPVTRTVSESVFAGTVNVDGTLEVEVTRLSGESVLARVVDMVAEAEARKGPSQLFARRVEQTFVPVALGLAPLLTAILYFSGVTFADAVLRGISVLVAASPCALAISTPAAVLSAVARAARAGVLIKGGTHLEALGKLKAVAFDKTGTLTEGKPKVVAIRPAAGQTENDLLITAAALENQSSHPLGRAIVEEASARGLEVPMASQTRALLGKGLTGQLEGQSIQVGSPSMFEGQTIPDWVHPGVTELQEAGRTAVVVERGGQFLGILGLADVARKDARATIKRLKSLGVSKTIMLSGDNLITARAIAKEVGVDEVKAPLLPEEKVTAIRDLAKETTVAMIGDGVNDAPALASASIGVAMGGAGSDVALETADIVLMADNLEALPFAVELARESVTTIKWNLSIAMGVSALLVTASCFGWVNISEAVVLHEGSTIVVVFNGLRLLWFKPSKP
ncbi:cadmium-translocating P-type ATPase, partial [bacterium]|nr:cadmium-translocating P-type ATPase [bacterium]